MKYKLVGPNSAYGVAPGAVVTLDHSDETVQLNIAAGILVPEGKVDPMTCPACADTMKRPPRLADQAELDEHYRDKHPGLVAPTWKEGGE